MTPDEKYEDGVQRCAEAFICGSPLSITAAYRATPALPSPPASTWFLDASLPRFSPGCVPAATPLKVETELRQLDTVITLTEDEASRAATWLALKLKQVNKVYSKSAAVMSFVNTPNNLRARMCTIVEQTPHVVVDVKICKTGFHVCACQKQQMSVFKVCLYATQPQGTLCEAQRQTGCVLLFNDVLSNLFRCLGVRAPPPLPPQRSLPVSDTKQDTDAVLHNVLRFLQTGQYVNGYAVMVKCGILLRTDADIEEFFTHTLRASKAGAGSEEACRLIAMCLFAHCESPVRARSAFVTCVANLCQQAFNYKTRDAWRYIVQIAAKTQDVRPYLPRENVLALGTENALREVCNLLLQ